jgi:hypothetical protein
LAFDAVVSAADQYGCQPRAGVAHRRDDGVAGRLVLEGEQLGVGLANVADENAQRGPFGLRERAVFGADFNFFGPHRRTEANCAAVAQEHMV